MVAATTGEQQSCVLRVKHFGVSEYMPVWRDMQYFTDRRSAKVQDELWLLEHQPVFTLGMNAKPEHVLACGEIPVIQADRGGQVTYHGPGQMVAYIMMDLRRAGLGIRQLVEALEQSVIDWLAAQNVTAQARREAPGVYVDGAKIAALGLRIRRGCSYHGLALNVKMDLEPFSRINPCGYRGLAVTQLSDLGMELSVDEASESWLPYLASQLDYIVRLD
ncbi:MAG: lipoyl(octanoyl) transferase LipB [Thiogranum sp.]